ncbi:MAG: hypothetical protein ACREON_16080, partial [Gemmatimonadaceae bacterium]
MTKRLALGGLVLATLALAAAYASAFFPGAPAPWAPWALALGIPTALVATMVLGAARGRRGVGRLAWPFAFVGVTLALGFGLALALPVDEHAGMQLWLGLPPRTAIVLYGIGLLPILVLPIAYALTFDEQTLNAEDLERVRRAGVA